MPASDIEQGVTQHLGLVKGKWEYSEGSWNLWGG